MMDGSQLASGGTHEGPFQSILISSPWRSSSTYIFEKLRSPDYLNLDEPLNEDLALPGLPERLRQGASLRDHQLLLKHPMSSGYFLDFSQYFGPDELPGCFDASFALSGFFSDTLGPGLQAYLASLKRKADSLSRHLLLGFVRSMGRLPAIRSHFQDPVNIVLRRDPFGVFWSSIEQHAQARNTYFLNVAVLCLSNSPDHPAVRLANETLGIPWGLTAGSPGLAPFERLGDEPGGRITDIFACYLALAWAQALRTRPILVDLDRLSASPEYRLETTRNLELLLHRRIDFSDCSVRRYDLPQERHVFETAFLKWVAFFCDRFPEYAPLAEGLRGLVAREAAPADPLSDRVDLLWQSVMRQGQALAAQERTVSSLKAELERCRQNSARQEERQGNLETMLSILARRPGLAAPDTREAVPGSRHVFLFEPDASRETWIEVVLSYLEAFGSGDPVALVLILDPARRGIPDPAQVQGGVLEIAQAIGREQIPDIAIVDRPEDLLEFLRGCTSFQWVPESREAMVGLQGRHGARFAESRARMTQSG